MSKKSNNIGVTKSINMNFFHVLIYISSDRIKAEKAQLSQLCLNGGPTVSDFEKPLTNSIVSQYNAQRE